MRQKIFFLFILIFVFGGLSYSKAISGTVSLGNILIGSLIIFQLLLVYWILSSTTLFVFTSIALRNDSNTWKTRLKRIINSILLSYSPLIILFILLDFVQYFNIYTLDIDKFIRLTTFVLKGITPIVLFITFWKLYKIEFFKSCLVISSYYIVLTVLTKIPSFI
ncbi:hypothetical protein [Clostridium sp. BL-8]|uniref:hypothetical protein n=1 Tax=Clostridium sp. BL-8 TaxID=349938 RepID=UPI00098CBD64|nr:hypothetical protein [Clostridium sp. BL-8]OOM73739.1 hypothetical protein CLOBL_45930 [Clostridium sp. BL-8]